MRRRGAGSREREGQPQGERPGCSATTSTVPLLSSPSSSPCLSSFLPAAAPRRAARPFHPARTLHCPLLFYLLSCTVATL